MKNLEWFKGFNNILELVCTVCFSSFKPIFEGPSEELELVIVKGDQLHTEQNTTTLSFVDFPE